MTAAASFRLILAHGLQQRSNRRGWWPYALSATLVLLACTVLLFWGKPRAAVVIAAILALTLVSAWWADIVSSLMLQNQPVAARLVPGHLARLRQVLLAAWLVASLMAGALFLLMGFKALPAWLMGSGYAALFGLLVRWPLGWGLISVLPMLLIWWIKPDLMAEVSELLRDRPAVLVLLSLVLLPLTLLPVLGAGGPGHRAAYERNQRWRQLGMTGESMDRMDLPAPLGALWQLVRAPYRAQLTRMVASPGPATLPARLMLGLGPAVHWTAQLSNALIFGAIFVAVCMIGILWVPIPFPDFLRHGAFGLTLGLMSALASGPGSLAAGLRRTRGEQRLLVLLPGVPRGAELNRWLALQWLRQFGLSWLGAQIVAVAVIAYSGASAEMLLPFLLAYLLPLVLVWRDWSRESALAPQMARTALAVVATALVGVALGKSGLLPVWLIAVAQLALATAVGLVCWRRQIQGGSALPVGRLA